MRAANWMPSVSSGMPKVNRSAPVVKSIPTVEMSTPKQPAIAFLIGESPPIVDTIESPNTARAKYSGGPNW